MKRLLAGLFALLLGCAPMCGCTKSDKAEIDATPDQALQRSANKVQPVDATGTSGGITLPSDFPDIFTTGGQTSAPEQTDASAPAVPDATFAPKQGENAFGDAVENAVTDHGFDGVAYAVQNGAVVYSQGSLSDIYHVCSVSKQFTAAAILMLAEEGRLDVDGTIDRYFPDYAHGGEVTVGQLMSMSSGIPDYLTADLSSFADTENSSAQNRSAALDWIFARGLIFTPGSEYYYCNSNYLLLSEIIEKVSGVDYEQFIRQRILSPLGMSSTGFGDTWSGGGSVVYSDEAYYRWFAYKGLCRGCGDMMSNAEDLAKWGVELCAHNLISDNIFRQMTAARVFGSEYNYGYGLMLCDDYIYHDGNLPPFCTTLSVLPAQGFVFVLLDCGDNSPLFDVREQIFTNSTYQ